MRLCGAPRIIKRYGGIYCIACKPASVIYIGQTKRCFEKRWQEHISELNKGKHVNDRMQAAWKQYRDDFLFLPLEAITSKDKAVFDRRERWWIAAVANSNEVVYGGR